MACEKDVRLVNSMGFESLGESPVAGNMGGKEVGHTTCKGKSPSPLSISNSSPVPHPVKTAIMSASLCELPFFAIHSASGVSAPGVMLQRSSNISLTACLSKSSMMDWSVFASVTACPLRWR